MLKLRNAQILDLANVIERMPPLQKADKGAYALARNLSRLKVVREKISADQQKIFETVFDLAPGQKLIDKFPAPGMKDWPQDEFQHRMNQHMKSLEKFPQADAMYADLLKEESEFEAFEIDYDKLNVAENPIQPAVLEILLPIIKAPA